MPVSPGTYRRILCEGLGGQATSPSSRKCSHDALGCAVRSLFVVARRRSWIPGTNPAAASSPLKQAAGIALRRGGPRSAHPRRVQRGGHERRTRRPRSFDRLHALIERQVYRLAYWRVAADEINYRRFFDINDLAALRRERPECSRPRTGASSARAARAGAVDGLRIDHPDGLSTRRLLPPAAASRRAQRRGRAAAESAARRAAVRSTSWSKRSPPTTSTCRELGRARHHRLPLRQRGQRPVRGRAARARSIASTRHFIGE